MKSSEAARGVTRGGNWWPERRRDAGRGLRAGGEGRALRRPLTKRCDGAMACYGAARRGRLKKGITEGATRRKAGYNSQSPAYPTPPLPSPRALLFTKMGRGKRNAGGDKAEKRNNVSLEIRMKKHRSRPFFFCLFGVTKLNEKVNDAKVIRAKKRNEGK